MRYSSPVEDTWRTHNLTIESKRTGLSHTQQEWLLTNGTGAYAMGTVSGIATRRYHGLLIAATHPPVGRVVALNQMLERLSLGSGSDEIKLEPWTACLFKDRYGGQVVSPQGHLSLHRFEKGLSVRWEYVQPIVLGDSSGESQIRFTRELELHWKQQAATLRYTVHAIHNDRQTPPKATLRLSPMLTLRDFHSLVHQGDPAGIAVDRVSQDRHTVTIRRGEVAVTLSCDAGEFVPHEPGPSQWWNAVHYPLENQRGQDDREDYFVPGWFEVGCDLGAQTAVTLTVALGQEAANRSQGAQLTTQRQNHLQPIADRLAAYLPQPKAQLNTQGLAQALAIAADDFVVDRQFQGRSLKTLVAGYPWFADWGRDTFIALPGLLLTTGRYDEAKAILEVFAGVIKDGLVPNRFDDYDEASAHYNSVDASLWFVHSAIGYVRTSGDRAAWDQWLADAVIGVVEAFIRGTDHGIQMTGDGLVTAGSPGTQLTWMDAACGGVIFTPRHGKAVEINALWYHALTGVAELIQATHASTADHYTKLAKRVKRSFGKMFWNDQLGHLYDHVWVDQDDQPHVDQTLRPNQILAVCLPQSPLPVTKQRKVIKAVRERLLTPYGLRTLPVDDPNYHGQYRGPAFDRDRAYHQGTVWPWLIGPYAEAVLRVGKFSNAAKAQALAAITPLMQWLMGDGLGQLHEIHEADPPHHPVGCMAQAWSVAQVLNVLSLLAQGP